MSMYIFCEACYQRHSLLLGTTYMLQGDHEFMDQTFAIDKIYIKKHFWYSKRVLEFSKIAKR